MDMKHKTTHEPDDIIRQLNSIRQVEPSEFLFAKVRRRIEEKEQDRFEIAPSFVWRMAAVFVVLVLVNMYVLFMSPEEISQETTMVVEELGLVSDNYDNY
jgi:hypothetical protein